MEIENKTTNYSTLVTVGDYTVRCNFIADTNNKLQHVSLSAMAKDQLKGSFAFTTGQANLSITIPAGVPVSEHPAVISALYTVRDKVEKFLLSPAETE